MREQLGVRVRLETSSRGASNTIVRCDVCRPGSITFSVFASSLSLFPSFLFLLLLMRSCRTSSNVETFVPESPVLPHPIDASLRRPTSRRPGPPLRVAALGDQAGALQAPSSVWGRREAQVERFGQFRDRSSPVQDEPGSPAGWDRRGLQTWRSTDLPFVLIYLAN